MSGDSEYEDKESYCAVLVAAGTSQRMSGIDKIFHPIKGLPLISYTVRVFEQSHSVSDIVLVLHQDCIPRGEALRKELGWKKVNTICSGGLRRQDSVLQGLRRVRGYEWVIIHDGARPCIDENIIERGIEAAKETGAAVAAIKVKDTIKRIGDDFFVDSTLNRGLLWAVQTPQIFRYDIIYHAYQGNVPDVYDDAMLIEKTGYKVKIFMGSEQNIKVTTPDDLKLVRFFLKQRVKI